MFSIFFDVPSTLKNLCDNLKTPSIEAASVEVENQGGGAATSDTVFKEAEADQGQEPSSIKKNKVGFRDRKILEYENRLRHYSTP